MRTIIATTFLAALLLAGVLDASAAEPTGWRPPEVIAPIAAALTTGIAVASNGNAIATWSQFDATTSDIYARRYVVGSGWLPAEVIETNNGVDLGPTIAMNANGTAFAVWLHRVGFINEVWANAFVPATGWGVARRIAPGAQQLFSLQVVVDTAGNAIATWVQNDTATGNWPIYAARGNAAQWGTPVVVETGTRFTGEFDIAMDVHGDALLARTRDLGGNSTLASFTFSATTGLWSGATTIVSSTGRFNLGPSVGIDANHQAFISWAQTPDQNSNALTRLVSRNSNVMRAGNGWDQTRIIGGPDPFGSVASRVVIDGGGNATVVWSSSQMFANRFTADPVQGGWGTPQPIEVGGVGGASQVADLVVDANGRVTALWTKPAADGGNIFTNLFVAGPGWGTAQLLDPAGPFFASTPSVGVDARGNAIALWVDEQIRLQADRYVAPPSFGIAQLAGTMQFGNSANPRSAINSSGNATAVWQRQVFDINNTDIYTNRFTASTGWAQTAVLVESGTGTARNQRVSMAEDNTGTMVWQQTDGSRFDLWSSDLTSTGVATTPILIEGSGGDATSPQLAGDRRGNLIAVWQQIDGTRSNIYANRRSAGGGWGTAELIERNDIGDARAAQIALDGNGRAIAVWTQFDGVRDSIFSNRFTPETGWGTPQPIEIGGLTGTGATGTPPEAITPNPCANSTGGAVTNAAVRGVNAAEPQITVNATGRATAIWLERATTGVVILCSNQFVPNLGWGIAQVVQNAPTANPVISNDANGNAIVVYSQSDGTRSNLYATRYTGSWSAPQLVENRAGNADFPALTVFPTGDAVAIWQQSDGTRNDIWGNRFIVGGGWQTPQLLETLSFNATMPSLSGNASGAAMALWVQSDISTLRVWGNRFQ